MRADAPSSRPLANTAFVVENQRARLTSFTTDDQGRFRTPLAPGHYKVSLKGRTSSIGRYGPFEVDVVAGQTTKVQWQCDSGHAIAGPLKPRSFRDLLQQRHLANFVAIAGVELDEISVSVETGAWV